MITKFNTSSVPSFVTKDVLLDDGQTVTYGYRIFMPGIGDQRIQNGDYIIQDENGVIVRWVPLSEYTSDLVIQNQIREEVGKDLIRAIWSALRASAMTDANKAGVATAISPVMGLIRDGEITSARFLANATTTTASYTAGVKSALLSTIDQAIAKL